MTTQITSHLRFKKKTNTNTQTNTHKNQTQSLTLKKPIRKTFFSANFHHTRIIVALASPYRRKNRRRAFSSRKTSPFSREQRRRSYRRRRPKVATRSCIRENAALEAAGTAREKRLRRGKPKNTRKNFHTKNRSG